MSSSTGNTSASSFDQLLNKQAAAARAKKEALANASAGAAGDANEDGSSSSSDDEGASSSDSDSDSDNESSVKQPKLDEFARSYGTGRRKTGVARVWIKDGSGQVLVNDKVRACAMCRVYA